APRLFVGVFDASQVGDLDRRAVGARNDQVAELAHHVEAAHRAHGQLFHALIEPAAGRFDVFVFQRAGHLIDGDVMAVELFGVEQDLNLAVAPAGDVNGRDAVHSLQRAFDLLIGDFSDLAQAPRPADDQRKDRVRFGIGLGDDGRLDVGRHLAHRQRHFLAHVLRGVFHLAVEHEAAGDARAAVHYHDFQFVQTADAAQLLFDGQYDLAGHFVGAGARQPDAHADDGRIGLGKEVDAEVHEREDAQHDQKQHQHRRKNGSPNTDFRQGHGLFLLCSSAVWNLRRAHRRAWRQDGFLARAAKSGQVYWDAEALCYYLAH